jgi:hypothetical protein
VASSQEQLTKPWNEAFDGACPLIHVEVNQNGKIVPSENQDVEIRGEYILPATEQNDYLKFLI